VTATNGFSYQSDWHRRCDCKLCWTWKCWFDCDR